MKKFVKSFKLTRLLFASAFVLMCGILFAQGGGDSTSALTSSTDSFLQTIITALEIKWPIIATIGSILWVISEALSGITSIKANGVFQLIYGILKSIFGKKTA